MNSTQAIEKAIVQADLATNNGSIYGAVNAETAKAYAMIAEVLFKMEQAE